MSSENSGNKNPKILTWTSQNQKEKSWTRNWRTQNWNSDDFFPNVPFPWSEKFLLIGQELNFLDT